MCDFKVLLLYIISNILVFYRWMHDNISIGTCTRYELVVWIVLLIPETK